MPSTHAVLCRQVEMLYQRYFLRTNQSHMVHLLVLLCILFTCMAVAVLFSDYETQVQCSLLLLCCILIYLGESCVPWVRVDERGWTRVREVLRFIWSTHELYVKRETRVTFNYFISRKRNVNFVVLFVFDKLPGKYYAKLSAYTNYRWQIFCYKLLNFNWFYYDKALF